jgi:hypothetical protein
MDSIEIYANYKDAADIIARRRHAIYQTDGPTLAWALLSHAGQHLSNSCERDLMECTD